MATPTSIEDSVTKDETLGSDYRSKGNRVTRCTTVSGVRSGDLTTRGRR